MNLEIASLECLWVKQLYDEEFHEWEPILLHLIKSTFGINFKFHPNLGFDDSKISHFLHFINNFSVTGASTFLLLLILHLLYCHNQFDITKILK